VINVIFKNLFIPQFSIKFDRMAFLKLPLII